MFSPPTRKDTTPCSSQRAEYEKKNTEHRTPNIERRMGNHSLERRWPRKGGRAGVRNHAPNRFNAQRSKPNPRHDARDSHEDQPKNTEHRMERAAVSGQ